MSWQEHLVAASLLVPVISAVAFYAWTEWRLYRRRQRERAQTMNERAQAMNETRANGKELLRMIAGSLVRTQTHPGPWTVLHVEYANGCEWVHLRRKHLTTGREEMVTVPASTCEPIATRAEGRAATVEEVRAEVEAEEVRRVKAAIGEAQQALRAKKHAAGQVPLAAGDVVRARDGTGPLMNVAQVEEGLACCWWFQALPSGGWDVKVLETAAACLERATLLEQSTSTD